MPHTEMQFSSLQVVVAAGEHHEPFLVAGCDVHGAGDLEVLGSAIGSINFRASFSKAIADKQLGIVEAVAALPDPHVTYYQLKHSCDASRMLYLGRTTPLRVMTRCWSASASTGLNEGCMPTARKR